MAIELGGGEQRVVVMVDASREISVGAIGGALLGLPLKAGDKFIIVAALHHPTNPLTNNTLSLKSALMGYIGKVEPGSILSVSRRYVDEEVIKKKEEYLRDERLKQVSAQCEMRKIEFRIEVQAGPSPKVVAVAAARSFRATLLVIDRQMKREKKYLMEKLLCGIVRVKSNNQIEQVRVGEAAAAAAVVGGNTQSSRRNEDGLRRRRASFAVVSITYGEMVEGSSEEEEERVAASEKGMRKSSSTDYLTTTRVSRWSYGCAEAILDSKSSSSQSHLGVQVCTEMREQTTHFENYSSSPAGPKLVSWECSVCNNRRPINTTGRREFTFAELQTATNNFASDNFLSEGGFGSVYRGELQCGLKLAVKLHKSASFQGDKEFTREVEVLSKARHDNLVMLLGSCSQRNHRLLVYEFVCNGSLDQHLSAPEGNPALTWEKRMKIAIGAARGLQYLHQNNIIHRDMRPNNILVTHDFEALLGDFGLAKTELEESSSSVVGTLGYLAPEYAECGKVSSKTDVYAFGVVLLQLITGKKMTDHNLGGRSLVAWARPLLKQRNYPHLIDHRIVDSHDVHQLFGMVWVAEKCLTKDPHKRLPMNTVVLALSCVMEGKSLSSIKDLSPAHSSAAGSCIGEGELTDSPCDDNNNGDDDIRCRRTHYCRRKVLPSPTSISMQILSCSAPEEIDDEDYFFDYII